MKGSLRLPLLDLFGVLMSAAVLLSRDSLLGDPGAGWHLKTGEWIALNRQLPMLDPFLDVTRPWVHDQWLSDLLFWQVYSWGGFPLLHAVVVTVVIATFALVLAPLSKRTAASAPGAFLILFLAALHASVQWFLRPVIFSFLFFAIAYRVAVSILERGRIPTSMFITVPIFFALWANLHAGFWLGLLVVGAAALELMRKEPPQRAAAAGLTTAALGSTLITPWGFALWRSTLALGTDPYFTRLNREWLSPDLADPGFFPVTLALLLLVFALVRGKARELSLFDWILLAPLAVLSLMHRRYLPFFGIALFVPLLRLYPLQRLSRFPATMAGVPVLTFTFWGFLLIAPFVLGRIPFFESRTSGFPRGMPDHVLEIIEREPGPVFHSPDIGGYITWKAWPRVRASIDDRNQLLGKGPYEDFFTVVRASPGWEEILRRTGTTWVILGAEYPLVPVLAQDSEWEAVPIPEGSSWRLFRKRHTT